MSKDPKDCQNMQDVRAGIDATDKDIIDLLVLRAAYIDRASEIKQRDGLPARISDRVEQVVGNVKTHADARGLSPDLAETLWRQLIEWSIAREEKVLGSDPN